MRLYEEIFKDVDGVAGARCLFLPGGGGYFEAVKSVEDFSPREVVIVFPSCRVRVFGTFLSIKKYCDGDLQLSGRIFSCEVLKDGSKIGAQVPPTAEEGE